MLAAILAAALAAAPPSDAVAPPASQTMAPPAKAKAPEPESIWRPGAGGEFEHLQSGLRCPAMSGDFRRDNVTAFNPWGTDVSCGYNGQGAGITMYLTRMSGLEEAFASAKASLDERLGEQGAKLVADDSLEVGGLKWRRAQYVLPGRRRSDIWLADAGGWLLKFRVTYFETASPAVDARIAALTTLARTTAMERLALCAKSTAPARPGKLAPAKPRKGPDAMMSALAGSISMATPDPQFRPPAPVAYCVEDSLAQDKTGFLLWRGVTADGADANADRLTILTHGPPPTLDVSLDVSGNIIAAELTGKATERWVATIRKDARVSIFGYFDKRPSAKTILPLMHGIMSGKSQPLSSYDADTKTITINTPGKD